MSKLELMAVRNVVNNFGPRTTREDLGGRNVQEYKKVARWEFNWNQLPVPGVSNIQQVIPAHSTIVAAYFRVLAAFTSTSTTTDLSVGLRVAAGTEIDDDGLLTAAHLSQTTIAVVGALYSGAAGTPGALINRTTGASNGELVVLATAADLLTGRAEVIVEYLTPTV